VGLWVNTARFLLLAVATAEPDGFNKKSTILFCIKLDYGLTLTWICSRNSTRLALVYVRCLLLSVVCACVCVYIYLYG